MKTSPARRVHQALKRGHDYPVREPLTALRLWAIVFGPRYEGSNMPPNVEDAAVRLLADLREEINTIERGPHSDEILPLVQPLVTAARNVTATSQLHADWNVVKQNFLRPETIAGWGWAAIYFPAEDDNVSEEILTELESRIAELEAAAAGKEVPEQLRRFIGKQVQTLRSAIKRYPVSGVHPLQDALSQSLGDAWRDQEEVAEAVKSAPKASAGLMEKMQEVYKTAVHLCGDADKLKKGYTLMLQAYQRVAPAVEYIKDAVS